MRELRLIMLILFTVQILGCGSWDEPLYHSYRRIVNRWHVNDRPTILIQLGTSGTRVIVTKGNLNEVQASVTLGTLSKRSQAIADHRVKNAPGVRLEKDGDIIRIAELPGNLVSCALEVRVPSDSSVEIMAPFAEIWVGSNGLGIHDSIPVSRLTVKTDRILHVDINRSSVGIPTLDLDAAKIEINIDGSPVRPTRIGEDRGSAVRYMFKQP